MFARPNFVLTTFFLALVCAVCVVDLRVAWAGANPGNCDLNGGVCNPANTCPDTRACGMDTAGYCCCLPPPPAKCP